MNKLIYLALFILSHNSMFSQKKNVYMIFHENSVEQCTVENEYGETSKIMKYRKTVNSKNNVKFSICLESFIAEMHDDTSLVDIDKIKVSTLNDLFEMEKKEIKKSINNSQNGTLNILNRQDSFVVYILIKDSSKNNYLCYPVQWIEKSH